MALLDTFRDGVEALFDGLDDLVDTVVYHRVSVGAYDPATNTSADTDVGTNVRGILVRGQIAERDYTQAIADNTRVLIPGVDVPAGGPQPHDYIVVNGKRYEIRDYKIVATDVLYIFFVRAP